MRRWMGMPVAAALVLTACVTINVYFPAAEAKEAAKQFVEKVIGDDAQDQQSHETPQPPKQSWSFAGWFGKYDPAQLQRGLKIYKEVCSACHSMSMVAFRNLADAGGPGYNAAQAAALPAVIMIYLSLC